MPDVNDVLTLRVLTLAEAAKFAGLSESTLRRAIAAGELVAWIPRGRAPRKAGAGQGYRINRAALAAYMNPETEASPRTADPTTPTASIAPAISPEASAS